MSQIIPSEFTVPVIQIIIQVSVKIEDVYLFCFY